MVSNESQPLSDVWSRKPGAHWHCYTWTGQSGALENKAGRRSPETDLPPFTVVRWLEKPNRLIRNVVHSPEEGAAWAEKILDEHRGRIVGVCGYEGEELRRFAEESLACGVDISWERYLTSQQSLVLAVVLTDKAGCRIH